MPAILITFDTSVVSTKQLFDMAIKQRQVEAAVVKLCTVDDSYAVRKAIEVGVILLNRITTHNTPNKYSRLLIAAIFFKEHCTAYVRRCLRLTTIRMYRYKVKQWNFVESPQVQHDYFRSLLGDSYPYMEEVLSARGLEAAIMSRDQSLDILHLINNYGEGRDFGVDSNNCHERPLTIMLAKVHDNDVDVENDELVLCCLYLRGLQWRLLSYSPDKPVYTLLYDSQGFIDSDHIDRLFTPDVCRLFMDELQLQMDAEAYWKNLDPADYAFQVEKTNDELISALKNWRTSENWEPGLDPPSCNGEYMMWWDLNENDHVYIPGWHRVIRW